MIVVVAHMDIAPGRAEEFIAGARTVVKETLANEPDCLGYACGRDLAEPSRFTFTEKWTDGAALRAHTKTDHFGAFGALLKEVVTGQVVDIHTVESTQTL
jgi:quinol monooxygenase YgiN